MQHIDDDNAGINLNPYGLYIARYFHRRLQSFYGKLMLLLIGCNENQDYKIHRGRNKTFVSQF